MAVRSRWPAAAAKDPTWAKMSVSERPKYTGEAFWKATHNDASSAQKLKLVGIVLFVAYILSCLPGVNAYVYLPLSFSTLFYCEVLLGVLFAYYSFSYWKACRGQTWTSLAKVFLPDSLLARLKEGGELPAVSGSQKVSAASPSQHVPALFDGSPSRLHPQAGLHASPWSAVTSPQSMGRYAQNNNQPGMSSSVPRLPWSAHPPSAGSGPTIPSIWHASPSRMSQSPQSYWNSPVVPTPEVCRPLAFGSPGSYGGDYIGRQDSDFRFRASPVPQETAAAPLPKLAEESYRNILRLTNRDGASVASLTAEGSTLQRDIFNHIVQLEKQITEVEKALRDIKELNGIRLEWFSPTNSLSEPLPNNQGTLGQALQEVLKHLSGELHQWAGGRPGRADRVRTKQVLSQRLKLERVLAWEHTLPSAMHSMEHDGAARTKQNRSNRQRFLARLRSIVSEGFHDGRREAGDAEVILHCFASLLDYYHFGSRHTTRVEWSGASAVFRYSSSRCPGLLQLSIESTTYERNSIYAVTHVDSDLGINTTYLTNPTRSLYEAMFFFLLIFEFKHPKKLRSTDDTFSQSRLAAISKQFLLEGTDTM
ncbi:hypothetical protein DIPPA_33167 [Diplonema papillatum]|nr:hypothetical protein DIPPA_33167 [Diplonema papillatum]